MIMENEAGLRVFFFVAILAIMAIWEMLSPRRDRRIGRPVRWVRNLSLVFLNSFLARVVVPFTAVGAALYAGQHQIGLWHILHLPYIISVILSLLMLDLLIYLQHVIFHHVPLLWRLHKIHHIDQEIDVTTGLRFHPLEIILSVLIKSTAVILLGVPVMAVVIFEILLNATAMFNHGNVKLPATIDRILRWIIVTPDMHRVHHSVIMSETNSNFGFNLPWWDRIFRTYQARPAAGHDGMKIGLQDYQDVEKTGLWSLIIIPFIWGSDKTPPDRSG